MLLGQRRRGGGIAVDSTAVAALFAAIVLFEIVGEEALQYMPPP